MYRQGIIKLQHCANSPLSLGLSLSPCQCRCLSASVPFLQNRNNNTPTINSPQTFKWKHYPFRLSLTSRHYSATTHYKFNHGFVDSKYSSTNSLYQPLLAGQGSLLSGSKLLQQSLYKSYRSRSGSHFDDDFEFDEYEGNRNNKPKFERRNRGHRSADFDFEDDYEDPYSQYEDRPGSRSGRYHRDAFQDPFSNRRFGGSMGGSRDMKDFQLRQKNWSSGDLAPVEKNFYVEHESISEMPQNEINAFYSTNNITIARGEKMRPVMDFHHANFPDPINTHMDEMRWETPTPIQSIGWPIALSGKNMVGIAQTGSGKTLGYTLPALVHIKHQRQVMRGEGPVALILAPTRELAQQIVSVTSEFGRTLGVRSCAVFGGASKTRQMRSLEQCPEIVVATPGRLLDFLESDVINLDRTTFTVLDEADRMLDMGFEPQIRKVLSQIRPDRQLLMWSATWPKEIQQLARDFLVDFTQVNVGAGELVANPNIEQEVIVCNNGDKMGMLKQLFDEETQKTLVFTQTKSRADMVTQVLRRSRLRALAIHGDKSQLIRDRTLDSFRKGETQILVATDVASRGLDVDDIKLVVNYDYPNTADDYVHRIGRTGRASKSGKAVSFITRDESNKVKDLISVLRDADQDVPEELLLLSNYRQQTSKSKPRNSFNGYKRHRREPESIRFYDDNTDWR